MKLVEWRVMLQYTQRGSNMGIKDDLVGIFGVGGVILFGVFWVTSILVSLAMPVVIIWGIFKLVKHFTGG